MDVNTPEQQNENTFINQEQQASKPVVTTMSKQSKSGGKPWKSPYALVFVVIFAAIGGYAIINSFAATASLTKVWQTSTDWSSGTLSSTAIVNNSVALASVVSTVTSTSNPTTTTAPTTTTITVPTPTAAPAVTSTTSTTNLALNKPVVASSSYYSGSWRHRTNLPATNAVDGNLSTRWGSRYSDPQWIYVDLGSTQKIGRVKLNWDTAYAKAYQIQVSNDAQTWTTIYNTSSGTGGVNDLTGLDGSGRYVRMNGTVRGTQWGYSLWEMSVYGIADTPAPTGYTVTVDKPVANQTVSGKTTFSGTQSGLKNVEVWYNGANVGTATINGNTWTATVDTTQHTNGAQTYTVYGWDVPAGQQAGNTVTQAVDVTVSNTAPTTTTTTTYANSGTISLEYDAGSSVTWTTLTPKATLPAGTAISYQARSSSDHNTWSAWNSDLTQLAKGRYIQVSANLSTTNTAVTPVLNMLTLGYNSEIASPTVTLTATPTSIAAGQNATLTWNSTNATSCTASGAWSGTKGVSGSTTSTALTANSSFSLACTGAGGTASASAAVTVAPASTSGGSSSSSGGCTNGGVLAPCKGGTTTGEAGWGAPAFDDEFNGSTLDLTKWSNTWYGDGTRGGCCQNNVSSTLASNVSVSGGIVTLTLSASDVGASINTDPGDRANPGFQFGTGTYIEGRVYFQGDGSSSIDNWPAFWTSGTPWPSHGEIDIAEGYDGTLTTNYWYNSGAGPTASNGPFNPGSWSDGYHIYAVDRENGQNYVYWDGKLIRSYQSHDDGGNEFIILNVGSRGGSGTQLKADYVRAWKK